MTKRMLAFLCCCALILAMIPATAPVAEAAVETYGVVGVKTETNMYRVGYGIRSADPMDPDNTYGTTELIAAAATEYKQSVAYSSNPEYLPKKNADGYFSVLLGGYGDNSYRWSQGKMDENGDGVINDKDGLKVTCIAVTDPDGNTVLFIAMDGISCDTDIMAKAKLKIAEKFGVPPVNVLINASHSHSGPLTSSSHEIMKAYCKILEASIVGAVEDALKDSDFATIQKASIEVENMNYVRHYTNGTAYKGDNFGPSSVSYTSSKTKPVSDPDATMHMLKITFGDSSKQPIALVNWRAHPKCNSTAVNKYGTANRKYSSSDYVGALRAYLSDNGYRTSFYQGAAGNINTHSSLTNKTNTKTLATSGTYKGIQTGPLYGKVLGQAALAGLKNNANFTTVSVGKVVALEQNYNKAGQVYAEGLIAAKQAWITQNKKDKAEFSDQGKFPYTYTWTDGNMYNINSIYHFNAISEVPQTGSANLNAIAIGEDLAFVTSPNEMYDRYDINGSTADADNDWNELINEDTFGTPIYLGYTNGSGGYIPNKLAYDYNSNTATAAPYDSIAGTGRGAYEANTTDFAEGAGEDIVTNYFKGMLHDLYNGQTPTSREAYCEACKKNVTWQPYVGFGGFNTLPSGHFYLCGDSVSAKNFQKTISDKKVVCLDLNGFTYGNQSGITGRAFQIMGGATLNIVNTSDKEGVIQGQGYRNATTGEGEIAGVIKVGYAKDNSGTLNLYDNCKLQYVSTNGMQTATHGGVVYVYAGSTFNMYGGTIADGVATVIAGNVFNAGNFNMYGGVITGGTTTESTLTSSSQGGNIYNTGNFVMGMANAASNAKPAITNGSAYSHGGNIWLSGGTATIYSGTISGGKAYGRSTALNGVGQNLVVNAGTNQILGGVIKFTGSRNNMQINSGAKLTLGGNAQVDGGGYFTVVANSDMNDSLTVTGNVQMINSAYIYMQDDNLTVQESFAGNITVQPKSYTKDAIFGYSTGAFTGSILMKNSAYNVKNANGELRVWDGTPTETVCPGCGQAVTSWTVLPASQSGEILQIDAGHYYLDKDRGISANDNYQRTIRGNNGGVVCLHTNGHRFEATGTATGRAFYVADGKTLNIFGGGTIAGRGVTNGGSGAVIQGNANTKINLSNVTVERIVTANQTAKLGTVIYTTGSLTLNNVRIIDGATPAANDGSLYIATNGSLTLDGNTTVGKNVYLEAPSANALKIKSTFTGDNVNVTLSTYEDGTIFGTNERLDNKVTLTDSKYITDNGLMTVYDTSGQCVVVIDGVTSELLSIEDALARYTYSEDSGDYIQLKEDITGQVSLNEPVRIEMNGFDMTVAIQDGGAVYGMEFATDDYQVADSECGVLTVVSGEPAEAELNGNRYLPLPGEGGTYTFHAFKLDTKKGLRPYNETNGTALYFQPYFQADQMVADAINNGDVDYGVLLTMDKTADGGEKMPIYQSFGAYKFDANSDNSTLRALLYGLMPNNKQLAAHESFDTQAEYLAKYDISKHPVTGQAYFKIGDTYILDAADQTISLREAIYKVDNLYPSMSSTSAQKIGLDQMWKNYSSVISSWSSAEDGGLYDGLLNIGNIKINISDWFK